jgi:hypothetical protein
MDIKRQIDIATVIDELANVRVIAQSRRAMQRRFILLGRQVLWVLFKPYWFHCVALFSLRCQQQGTDVYAFAPNFEVTFRGTQALWAAELVITLTNVLKCLISFSMAGFYKQI